MPARPTKTSERPSSPPRRPRVAKSPPTPRGDPRDLSELFSVPERQRTPRRRDAAGDDPDATPHIDIYGSGGVVEELEKDVARRLGKESALFMITGTMAQQAVLRIHADRRNRKGVVFHPKCHLDVREERAYERLHGLVAVTCGPANEPLTSDATRHRRRAGRGGADRTTPARPRRHAARVGRARRPGPVGARPRRGGAHGRRASLGGRAVLRRHGVEIDRRRRRPLRHGVRLVLQGTRRDRRLLRRGRHRDDRGAETLARSATAGAPSVSGPTPRRPSARCNFAATDSRDYYERAIKDRASAASHRRRGGPPVPRPESHDARSRHRTGRRRADRGCSTSRAPTASGCSVALTRPRVRDCSASSSTSATPRWTFTTKEIGQLFERVVASRR